MKKGDLIMWKFESHSNRGIIIKKECKYSFLVLLDSGEIDRCERRHCRLI